MVRIASIPRGLGGEMDHTKDTPDWMRLEDQVAQMFRLAGYNVAQNVEIDGFEFDCIAEQPAIAGFGLKIVVECKFRSGNAVPNTEIHAFKAAFESLQRDHQLTHAIVVTNTRFSRQAHEAAAKSRSIKLMSVESLEAELLGSRLYLERSGGLYRSTAHQHFIDLHATLADPDGGEAEEMVDVVPFLIEKLSQKKRHFAFLLGDFGSGKTSVAEQVHARLAARAIEDVQAVFPVILYLGTLPAFESEKAFIDSQLSHGGRGIHSSMLGTIAAQRPLLFILDGFDEVATNASESERLRLFSQVMRIASKCSHLLVTSRSAYFNNLREIHALVDQLRERDFRAAAKVYYRGRDSGRVDVVERNMQLARRSIISDVYPTFDARETSTLFLRPFSRDDFLHYLGSYRRLIEKRHGLTLEEIYQRLGEIYDLSDLVTRPMFLDLFRSVLLEGDIDFKDPDLKIGAAGIYAIYINLHLERDWKLRQFLTRDERLEFAKAAALAMVEAGGSLEASYRSVEQIVIRRSHTFDPVRREQLFAQIAGVVTDVRVCSFMNITPRDRIEFSHRSFMEYFVASVIVEQLREGRRVPELDLELNSNILYFVGSHCIDDRGYRSAIIYHFRDREKYETQTYRSNLTVALIHSGRISEGFAFENVQYAALTVRGKHFIGCVFKNLQFRRVSILNTKFENSGFFDVVFSGDIHDARFLFCNGAIRFSGALSQVELVDCSAIEIASSETMLDINGGAWIQSSVELTPSVVRARKLNVVDCRISYTSATDLIMSDCMLENVTLSGWGLPGLGKGDLPGVSRFPGTEIGNTRFDGISIAGSDYASFVSLSKNSKGIVFVRDAQPIWDDEDEPAFTALLAKKSYRFLAWKVVDKLFVATEDYRKRLEPLRDEIIKLLDGDLARPDLIAALGKLISSDNKDLTF
jgi:hypothetical protein